MTSAAEPDPAGPNIERRLATILCADVAGYSQLMGADEERTVRVFRGHREIFESLVKMHRGRIFNTAGDALLVEFSSAVEAVRCATEIQAALSTRNGQLAPEERMQFRMGINLGDVIVQGNDLLGDGVNVAARIQTATEPGGICISGSVYDQIQNKLSLAFKPLGEQVYKNIAKPVRTYTINEGAAVTQRARGSRLPAAIAAAVVALAGASYWGYAQYDAQRTERLKVEAQMAAQLAAQKQATEQAQRAAEDAKRDAQLKAEKQAADEALRRTQEERARLEQDRKQLENEKRENDRRASEAAKKQAEAAQAKAPAPAAPPAAPAAAPKTSSAFDGSYSGQLCNRPSNEPKPNCWQVSLFVRNGGVEGNWPGPDGKPSRATGTVAPDGTVTINLAGWTRDGREPAEAVLAGHAARDGINASGQWRGGLAIAGTWKRAQASATGKPTTRYDGTYAGRLCNNPKDDAKRNCWQADLTVRNGAVEANWMSRSNNPSSARGNVADEGTVELKLSGWTREAKAVEGSIAGRIADDAISAAGRWADGGQIAGEWKRTR